MTSPCYSCRSNVESDVLLCPKCGQLPIYIQYNQGLKEMTSLSENLMKKVNKMRDDFVISKNLEHNDERNQFLGALSYQLGWVILQTKICDDFTKGTAAIIPQWILANNPNMKKEQLYEVLLMFDNANRRAYFTNFMFSLEVFLKRINAVLPTQICEKGYKKLVNHVVKQLEMTDHDNEHYRILYFPVMVRNTLHMNGKHVDENDNGKIAGIMFKFIKNQSLKYTSWRHLYFFSDKIIDTVRIILENKKIVNNSIPTFNPTQRTY